MQPVVPAGIYLDGHAYDAMFHGGDDLPFWLELARRHGDPVLELACGTGRVSLPLARAGFRVTGLDAAPSMMEVARARAAGNKLDIAFIEGDMRDFDLGERFPLILCPANAFLHLLTRADIEDCLANVRRHLTPEGRFALDIFIPKPELLVEAPGKHLAFGEYDDPQGRGYVTVTHSYRYEAHTQIKRITTYHTLQTAEHAHEPARTETHTGTLDMRMLFPQELDVLLEYNGFTITGKFEDYAGTPIGPKSDKQLTVCKLAES
jgi:ubiquinone/menaquinone biosynthesis C-methylase UbiE